MFRRRTETSPSAAPCTDIALTGGMQSWEAPKLEEIEMNAEIGGYQPDSPDERGDEPPFIQAQAATAPPGDGEI